jgi:hypothetical protein
MIMVCVKTNTTSDCGNYTINTSYLTIGKKYEVVDVPSHAQGNTTWKYNFWVLCDDSNYRFYSSELFISLDEWRERQLNKIGLEWEK